MENSDGVASDGLCDYLESVGVLGVRFEFENEGVTVEGKRFASIEILDLELVVKHFSGSVASAIALYGLGQFDESKEMFEAILEVEPENVKAWVNLAILVIKRFKTDEMTSSPPESLEEEQQALEIVFGFLESESDEDIGDTGMDCEIDPERDEDRKKQVQAMVAILLDESRMPVLRGIYQLTALYLLTMLQDGASIQRLADQLMDERDENLFIAKVFIAEMIQWVCDHLSTDDSYALRNHYGTAYEEIRRAIDARIAFSKLLIEIGD